MNKNDVIIIKTFIINKYDEALVAAVEYVTRRYNDHDWFNGLLAKSLINMEKKTREEIFKPPLIFKYDRNKQEDVSLVKGYHYIIDTIEKYYMNCICVILFKKVYTILVIIYLIVFILFFLLLIRGYYYFFIINKKY